MHDRAIRDFTTIKSLSGQCNQQQERYQVPVASGAVCMRGASAEAAQQRRANRCWPQHAMDGTGAMESSETGSMMSVTTVKAISGGGGEERGMGGVRQSPTDTAFTLLF
jgi:hypothetical protein